MAQALGHQAFRQGKKVKFIRCSCLFRTLKASRAEDTWDKHLKGYVLPELLIIDYFGLKPLNQIEAKDLYELIVERHLGKSFIFISNRALETLREQTNILSMKTNEKQRGVDWQFNIDDARRKLKSIYPKI